MIKRFSLITASIILLSILTGCSTENTAIDEIINNQTTNNTFVSRDTIIKEKTTSTLKEEEQVTTSIKDISETTSPITKEKDENVDIDLTKLSSTMRYSEIANIMFEPEQYLYKTIKISGTFRVYPNDEMNKNYYIIEVYDSSACCIQEIEFIVSGDIKYPDDYPAEYSDIEIIGTFDVYDEYEFKYYYLLTDKINLV